MCEQDIQEKNPSSQEYQELLTGIHKYGIKYRFRKGFHKIKKVN